ncbi:MAG TPA: uroporphyrinogen-III synthase [Bacteroidales bacterium]|nr:MAG: uroporphyrinogen-III synthase [Bacteroidetes bacterium GWE2_42_24]OFY31629.1 MAG: uroporphyrinogen-III synthase [Bacteroidetes bacterium GWF2_43_11]HAQ64436.1 uroporphyrinogen-III synthase [Bacteroidales bacterium]HBZ67114.1 uroporphyrinogen-III synthase [Bacteroidales bacterium]
MKVKRILVSQPEPTDGEKSPYSQIVKKHGVTIDFHKFFRIEGITAKEFRKQRINILDYTAIVFTSRNAVDHFFRLSKEVRVEMPDTMKYFCISESTAYYLQKYIQYRKRKIFFGKQTLTDLGDVIKKHKSDKFLIPCSDIAKNDVPQVMEDMNVTYSKAVIYKTVAIDLSFLSIKDYDMLIFFSPVGIKSLYKNFPKFTQGKTVIGTFGATTQKQAIADGLLVEVFAPTATNPSMTMAIDDYLSSPPTRKRSTAKSSSSTPKEECITENTDAGVKDNTQSS